MNPSRFRRYWPLLIVLPLLAFGVQRMLTIRPMAIVDNGPIGNGAMLTGTVVTPNTGSWSFYENAGNGFIVLNADSTDAQTDFEPRISILDPSGTVIAGPVAGSPGVRINTVAMSLTTPGTYKAQVSNFDGGTFTGTVHLNLNVSDQPFTVPPGTSGGVMYSSTNYSGSIGAHKMNMNMWSYAAKSGDSLTITATGTAGINSRAYFIDPAGAVTAATVGGTAVNTFFNPALTGNYIVFFGDIDNSATSTNNYTLKAVGSSVLPEDGKTDGGWCLQCYQTAQLAGAALSPLPAAAGNTGGKAAGEPINVATGNVYESATDYSTMGVNPLAMTRSYNSLSYTRNLLPGMMGVNWRNTYDRYLLIVLNGTSTMAAAQRADGRVLNFYCGTGTTCTPDTDVDASLTYSGSTWTLTDSDDTVETYTVASGVGTLNSIKLRNGYTQTMHYTSGKLSSVTDTYGRHISLTWTGSVVTGVTTPDSLSLTYGYTTVSGQSLLTSVTYSTSPTTHITYVYGNTSLPYALTGITDENGHSYASWAYDGIGRAVSSQLSGGVNFTSVTYFDNNGQRNVTGPLGIQETYKFTNLQGVPKVSEIDRAANGTVAAANEKFLYDTNGYLKSVTDWNGNNTWFTNNSHGLPTAIVFASGNAVTHTTSITYDSTWAGNHHARPDQHAELLQQQRHALDPRRRRHDQPGDSVFHQRPEPHLDHDLYQHGADDEPATPPHRPDRQDDLDLCRRRPHQHSGREGPQHQPGDLQARRLAADDPRPEPHADHAGLFPAPVVDLERAGQQCRQPHHQLPVRLRRGTDQNHAAGQQLPVQHLEQRAPAHQNHNALSETANFTYNSAGGLTQTLWKTSGGTTKRQHTATYDALNRLLTDVGGASQTTTYGYDSNGNVTKITDPLSHVTTNTWDALNRLSTSKDAELNLVTTTYDAHDRVLTVKDGKSNTTTYIYDGFGDRISQVSPDSGTSVFWFDKDSNVTKQSAFAVTNYTYDALERLLTRTYPADSTLNVSLTYDQSGHGSGVGHLTSVTDQAGSLSLSYDQRGLTTANNRTISSQAYNTGYTYESAGRLATITYASAGWKLTYVRDSAGQITSVTDKPPSSGAVNLATSVTHMPFGPVASFTYGNGVTDTRTYDLDYRMTSVKDTATSNIQYNSYGYDADNNVHTITDNVTSANNQTLTYNRIDALKSATGVYGTISSITYDSNSNRLTYGSTTYTVPSGSDKMSAIGATSITYSSTGNLTAIGTTPTFTWNKANQMATGVLSGTTSTYLYGYDSMRQKITVGTGVPSVTQYDPAGELIFENNTRVETDYAYLDGMPIAAIQPVAATVSALHTDQIGTVLRATNASKTVVFTANYDPNGKTTPTTTITQNMRLPYNYNDATKLYHNGVRDNNPDYTLAGGRYAEVDPLGLGGGINPYIYAGNNAYRFIDPWGLDAYPQNVYGPMDLNRNPPDHWVNQNAVMYTAPDGEQFLAPPQAKWCDVYETGTVNGPNFSLVGKNVGQGGVFDFQRQGGEFYPSYTRASNYGVGVYMNGAGYNPWSMDTLGYGYAVIYSSNWSDPLLGRWWNNGWKAAQDLPSSCACHAGQ